MALSKTRLILTAGIPGSVGVAGAVVWFHTRRTNVLPGQVTLVKAPESTVIGENGAVRSTQTAKLAMPEPDLERLWTASNLENLGASYWHFLTRATLGMVRVIYSDTDRRVTLFAIPSLTLLRFDPPEFEMHDARAKISWQIKDGLLVASNGRAEGGLSLEVTRARPGEVNGPERPSGADAELSVAVEVTNFYPSIASRLGDFMYRNTQAFLHVTVTNAFLHSLGRLELHQSRVGRFLVGSVVNPERPPR